MIFFNIVFCLTWVLYHITLQIARPKCIFVEIIFITRRRENSNTRVAIGGMISRLTELEAPPIEFDEKLWHAVVDRVTVYNDDRLVYSLKDGTEITVEL